MTTIISWAAKIDPNNSSSETYQHFINQLKPLFNENEFVLNDDQNNSVSVLLLNDSTLGGVKIEVNGHEKWLMFFESPIKRKVYGFS